MIHPSTEIRFVSDEIGYGVFATRPIPKGTVVYVKDQLEIILDDNAFKALDDVHKDIATKYSYIDECGKRILSWDNAKYVNHSCNCNTISTGYGFEIAIRDIAAGEEITDEYGLFNIDETIPLACNCPCCRKLISPEDIDNHFQTWDSWIIEALGSFQTVEQPLMQFMDTDTRRRLEDYLAGSGQYASVISLKCNKQAA